MSVPFYIISLRKGLEAHRTSITPALGEPIYTTDTRVLYIGDGVTPGGIPLRSEPVGFSIEFNPLSVLIDDSENSGLDIITWKNVINVIRFDHINYNSIWMNFSIPPFWRDGNDVRFNMHYTLDSPDYNKAVRMEMRYYVIRRFSSPDYNNPDGMSSFSFLSGTNNVNLYSITDFGNQFKITGNHLTDPNAFLISVKLSRAGDNSLDNYNGNLLVSRIVLSQQ
ncbi:MAG: hypothetical protein QXD03_04825 [Candidatus Anstonellales archaeon]